MEVIRPIPFDRKSLKYLNSHFFNCYWTLQLKNVVYTYVILPLVHYSSLIKQLFHFSKISFFFQQIYPQIHFSSHKQTYRTTHTEVNLYTDKFILNALNIEKPYSVTTACICNVHTYTRVYTCIHSLMHILTCTVVHV